MSPDKPFAWTADTQQSNTAKKNTAARSAVFFYRIYKYYIIYIINQKAEVLCELPYYSVTFKDKDTLLVSDSKDAIEYELKIADLIKQ